MAESASYIPELPPQPRRRNEFRVAIICALPLEAQMVESVLDQDWSDLPGGRYGRAPGDTNTYTTGAISGHNVILAHMPGMGSNDAAAVASRLKSSFPAIDFAFVVGICGAVPYHPTTKAPIVLGDCLISTAVVQYDFGRQHENSFRRKDGLDTLGRARTEVRTFVAKWSSPIHRPKMLKGLKTHLTTLLKKDQTIIEPSIGTDRLFPSDYVHTHRATPGHCDSCHNDAQGCDGDCETIGCDIERATAREHPQENSPEIHYGCFGSANTVLKSGSQRDALAKADDLVAFEMESSGVWDIFPTIVVKSACDYADSHKNKAWQKYAAATAAAALKALLEKLELPEHALLAQDSTLSQHPQEAKINGSRSVTPVPQSTAPLFNDLELKCLQAFCLEPSYRAMKDRNLDRAEGTCCWFLSQQLWKDWLNSPRGCLLVSADPGCGKSVLAKFLIDYEIPSVLGESVVCYYFFKDQAKNDLVSALSAVLHQLLSASPDGLRMHAVPAYQKFGAKITERADEMIDLVREIVDQIAPRSVIIVLDALDECERIDCKELFRHLKSLEKIGNLKLLFTGRPYDYITSTFGDSESTCRLHIPGENESGAISAEVNIVIKKRLDKLIQQRRLDVTTRETLEQKLLAETHRTYLWIHLVLLELEESLKKTPRELEMFFSLLPKSVNEAYNNILNKATTTPGQRSLVRSVLSLILGAARPLSVDEIQCAVKCLESSVHHSHDDLDLESPESFAYKLRDWCGLFIQIHSNVVTLIHHTAREFLLNDHPSREPASIEGSTWEGTFTMEQSFTALTEACINYIMLCTQQYPGSKSTRLRQPDVADALARYPFLEFAASWWDSYYQLSKRSDMSRLLEKALAICDPVANPDRARLWLSIVKRPSAFAEISPVTAIPYGVSGVAATLLTDAITEGLFYSPTAVSKTELITRGLRFASMGHPDNMTLLLSFGQDLEARGQWDDLYSPMSHAMTWAIYDNFDEMLVLLLNMGGDANGTTIRGVPFVFAAIDTQFADLLTNLIVYAHDLSIVWSPMDITALHYAALRSSGYNMWLLVNAGASLDAQDRDGRTPLHYALASDYYKGSIKIPYLTRCGSLVNAHDFTSTTPLHIAAYFGHSKNILQLLQAGASIDTTDDNGQTALNRAVRRRNLETTVLLILLGADISFEDKQHHSPMSIATEDFLPDTDTTLEQWLEEIDSQTFGLGISIYEPEQFFSLAPKLMQLSSDKLLDPVVDAFASQMLIADDMDIAAMEAMLEGTIDFDECTNVIENSFSTHWTEFETLFFLLLGTTASGAGPDELLAVLMNHLFTETEA